MCLKETATAHSFLMFTNTKWNCPKREWKKITYLLKATCSEWNGKCISPLWILPAFEFAFEREGEETLYFSQFVINFCSEPNIIVFIFLMHSGIFCQQATDNCAELNTLGSRFTHCIVTKVMNQLSSGGLWTDWQATNIISPMFAVQVCFFKISDLITVLHE